MQKSNKLKLTIFELKACLDTAYTLSLRSKHYRAEASFRRNYALFSTTTVNA